MKKIILYILLLSPAFLLAQQEVIMTKYTFNSLFFNPAYAGSHGPDAGTATVQYRNQWVGVDGAPTTLIASGEGSFFKNKVGLGATISRESIGAYARTELSLNSNYRIDLGRGYLSGGLRTSLFTIDSDFNQLNIKDRGDVVYDPSLQMLTYLGVGFGAYYHDENMYLGLSIPTIASIGAVENSLDRVQHIFFNAGMVLGSEYSAIKILPSLLIKYEPSVPLQMSLSTMIWLQEKFAVGAHWRYNDALALSVEVRMMDRLKMSLAYDFTINDLNAYSVGSPEIMLGYIFGSGGNSRNEPSNTSWYF